MINLTEKDIGKLYLIEGSDEEMFTIVRYVGPFMEGYRFVLVRFVDFVLNKDYKGTITELNLVNDGWYEKVNKSTQEQEP